MLSYHFSICHLMYLYSYDRLAVLPAECSVLCISVHIVNNGSLRGSIFTFVLDRGPFEMRELTE